MNRFQITKIWKGPVSLLLALALLGGLCWPILAGQRVAPENPITRDNIQNIDTILLGEDSGVEALEGIEDPKGTASGESGGETQPGDPSTTEPTDPEASTEPTEPEDREVPTEPNTDETKPDPDEDTEAPEETKPGEEEGDQNQDGNTGSDGSEDTELDLGLVLTWYKYGTEPKTVVCAPNGSTGRTIRDGQLQDGSLRYTFSFTGTEAEQAHITGIRFGTANTPGEAVRDSGAVQLMIPENMGYQNYSFAVTAEVEATDPEGAAALQQVDFTVVIHYEAGIDLDLELQWQCSGAPVSFLCGANTQVSHTIQSAQLSDGLLQYALMLRGEASAKAVLTQADYTTSTGQSGTLQLEGGSLLLAVPEGSKTEIYTIHATAEYREEDGDTTPVYFTIQITYVDDLDLKLQFVWYRNGLTAQTVACRFDEQTAVTIKRNQLAGGNLAYALELTGTAAQGAKIISAELISGSGFASLAVPQGSCYLTLPDGQTTVRYTLVVKAQAKQGEKIRVVEFPIAITYSADLSLQLSYTLREAGGTQTYSITCENRKTRQADIVYDDQLDENTLPYTMTLVGGDAEAARITSVLLYRSGSGQTLAQEASGSAVLMLNDGKLGENTFAVTAEDAQGNIYTFTVNIPYKHRGANAVWIELNLPDGAEVVNESEITLTVTAWSEDDAGQRTYILATGVDTVLTVMLDGVLCASTGQGSGHAQQYSLIPANPPEGDENKHILYVYAEDSFGNFAEKTITLQGRRSQTGHVEGKASVYIDMTTIGLGILGPVSYDILKDEPVSYVVAKAVWGYDAGEPFGTATQSFGWADGKYSGTLDVGFYLRSMSDGSNMGARSSYYTGVWSSDREETLAGIDAQFGAGSGMATLWRCIYLNGITRGTDGGYYVGEFDYTGGSGWLYSVNGYYPNDAMTDYELRDGDVLILRYSLAEGWDVGAGTSGYGSTVGYCVTAVNGRFSIQHRLERIENADGSISYICQCCGLEEACEHENTAYKDREDGTHALFCGDCGRFVSDPEAHGWQYAADEGADTHTRTCQQCLLAQTEAHKWIEQSNSATCTEGGIAIFACADCGGSREEESPPKGHQLDNTVYHDVQEHWQKCQVCKLEIEGSRGSHSFRYDQGEADWICDGCGLLHDFDGCGNKDLTLLSANCKKLTYHCPHCGRELVIDGSFEEYHDYADGTCIHCGERDPALPPEEPEFPVPTAKGRRKK